MTPRTRALAAAAMGFLGVVCLSGCTENRASADDGAITVVSTKDSCEVATAEAPSGTLVFRVENTGDQVTEFYLLAEDGLRIVAEVENIGPGLSRDLVVQAAPGAYFTACKPGMVGDGFRAPFTVTDGGADLTP
jgi:iron uptake system component EfeO